MILKLLAILTMFIDHAGILIFDNNFYMRMIGRLAFALFAYMLIDNYVNHTRDRVKYILRLFALATVSQAFYMYAQVDSVYALNIIFLLAISIFIIYTLEHMQESEITFYSIFKLSPVILIYYCEYSYAGLALILSIYLMLKKDRVIYIYLLILTLMINMQIVFWGMIPIFIFLINCQELEKLIRYNRSYKYLYYAFYPVHLFVLKTLSNFL